MKLSNILNNSQIERIQSLVLRFDNAVTELQIRNWLEQFEFDEWDTALEVLTKLEYFTSKRMMKEYNEGLKDVNQKIQQFEKRENDKIKNDPLLSEIERQINKHKRNLRKKGKNEIFIHPIGEFGKSGSTMLYYVTHAPCFKKTNFTVLKNIDELAVNNFNNHLHLILLDDFSGSGDTIINYVDTIIKPQLMKKNITNIQIYILSIAFMSKAKASINEQLKEYSIELIGSERVAAFSSIGSPFGYRPKMLKVREFCYKYGKTLYSKVEYDNGKKVEYTYPLGYKNTQSLIAFEHTVPNNTLPIIWSVQNSWKPLFPRVIGARIKEVKEFKNQTKVWLSLAKDLGYENIFGTEKNVYSSENLKLLCYIRLLKRNLVRPIIAQNLNLTTFEVDEVVRSGIEKGLFLNENKLTKYGEKLYSEIKKKSDFTKQKVEEVLEDIIYIPKTFRGKT